MEKNEIFEIIKTTLLFIITAMTSIIMLDVAKLTDYFINYVGLG